MPEGVCSRSGMCARAHTTVGMCTHKLYLPVPRCISSLWHPGAEDSFVAEAVLALY